MLSEGPDGRIHTKLPGAVTDMLDRAFPGDDREKILSAFSGFTERYLSGRFGPTAPQPPKGTNVDEATVAALAATNKNVETLSATVASLATSLEEDRKARKVEATSAKRSNDIAALCEQAGCATAATFIADESLSVEDVKNKLFSEMCSKAKKLSDGDSGDVTPSDYAKLEAEWKKVGEDMLSAGWTKESWLDFECAERKIEKPAAK